MFYQFLSSLHSWKLVTVRKLAYLPRLLPPEEKRLIFFLILITLLGGIGFFTRTYLRFTHPIPTIGGSYTEGLLGEIRSLHPLYASRDAERDISRLLYSGLFTYDSDGKLLQDLAADYEIGAEGKNYTVRLRENAMWHDGIPLTADDIIFTIQTIQNPQYQSPFRTNWQGVKVEKINDHEMRFVLRTPYAPFIENLTLGIIPRHLWNNVRPEQVLLHELNLKPVGSGPYQFARLEHRKDGSLLRYEVTRWKKYHREGPYLKKIAFLFFNTEEELLNAWHRDTIEGFGPVTPSYLRSFNQEQVAIFPLHMPRVFGIFFNEKQNAILADKRIRAAIAHALDKELIAERSATGGAISVESPLPWIRNETATNTNNAMYPYDAAKAQKLLQDAGWKDGDEDGIRGSKTYKKGKTTKLRLTLLTSDWPYLVTAAEHIRLMLGAVGIGVAVERRPFTELESLVIRPRNFEMLLFGQVYGHEPDPFAFWHSSQIKDPGLNITFYHNKKADQLLEEARRTNDTRERNEQYQKFSTLVVEDLPAIFLFSQRYFYLLPRDIQGVNLGKIALPADRFNEINRWYRKTDRILR